MFPVIWTQQALDNIDRLLQDLSMLNPEAATRAAKTIRQAGDSLSRSPKRGPMVQGAPGVRKLRVPFGQYGYIIHYAILGDEVIILHVYHARQNRPT